MARRGAKPTPTVLRRLNGNPSGRKMNDKEAMPSRDISLEPPEWAKLNEEGKKVWFRIAPMIHRNGLLTECDLILFARYCDMLPRWFQMKQFIEEHGETYEVRAPVYEKSGTEKIIVDYTVVKVALYPQMKLYLDFAKALQIIEVEFGLSPSSRTRINAVEDDNNPTDLDFYFGGRRRASHER